MINTNQGYDVRATSPKANDRGINAYLSYGREGRVPLWVFDVSTGFALEGSTAQSARTRSFFVHNASQPTVSVSSQFPSQESYGNVAELIRKAHLDIGSGIYMKLEIAARWPKGSEAHRNNKYGGTHSPLGAYGWVQHAPRQHRQHEYSPTMTFDFIVKQWTSGWDAGQSPGWNDSAVNILRLKSWHDIIASLVKNSGGTAYEADPDADANDIAGTVGDTTGGRATGGARRPGPQT
jgi:hypothetical protein